MTTVIFGARTPQQLAANVAAAQLQLAPDTIAALGHVTDDLKHALGPNADLWEGASRIT